MFIKQAYEKRVIKEHHQENEGIYQSRAPLVKIGSIKNKKMNYDRDEQFFSNDDVPINAMSAKQHIQQFIDADNLGLRKRDWNSSTSVPLNPALEQTHERKLIKIKLGLLDHPQPQQKDKKIYSGTDTRDDYTGWQVSTQLIQKEIENDLKSYTMYTQEKNKEKEEFLLQDYMNPTEAQNAHNDRLRTLKVQEQEYRKKIRDQYEYDHPDSSKEKVDGAVYRLLYENQLQQKQMIQDPALTFKPNTSNSRRSRNQITKQIQSYHNGVFETRTIQKKDQEPEYISSWSCCMQEEQNAPGCQKSVTDKAKWIYSSFNQA